MKRNFNTQTSNETAALKQARTSKIHQIVNILAAREWHTDFYQSSMDWTKYIHLISKKHA